MIRRLRVVGRPVADYIDRNILCQAYVHIEADHLSDEERADLQRHIALFVGTRGRFFLYESVTTDVEFKEGSLKIYGTIAGALYIAISQYGSFRSGVDYLATDAKRLAECIAAESLFLTKSRHDSTIRVEARVGVVGSLKTSIDKLERISYELGSASVLQSTKAIQELQTDMERLMENLKDASDPPYVSDEFCKLVVALLPVKPPLDPKRPKPSADLLSGYRRARGDLIESVRKAGNQSKDKA